MNKAPIFRTLMLCATGFTLGYSIWVKEWMWIILLLPMVVLDVVILVKAIRTFKGRYRTLQISSCANTLISVWCSGMALNCFSNGEVWQGWLNVVLAVLNLAVVLQGQRALKRGILIDSEIARWKAEFFTEEDLKLFDEQTSKATAEGRS